MKLELKSTCSILNIYSIESVCEKYLSNILREKLALLLSRFLPISLNIWTFQSKAFKFGVW